MQVWAVENWFGTQAIKNDINGTFWNRRFPSFPLADDFEGHLATSCMLLFSDNKHLLSPERNHLHLCLPSLFLSLHHLLFPLLLFLADCLYNFSFSLFLLSNEPQPAFMVETLETKERPWNCFWQVVSQPDVWKKEKDSKQRFLRSQGQLYYDFGSQAFWAKPFISWVNTLRS